MPWEFDFSDHNVCILKLEETQEDVYVSARVGTAIRSYMANIGFAGGLTSARLQIRSAILVEIQTQLRGTTRG